MIRFVPSSRKVYVLSTTDEFKSHWMIFDVHSQIWTVYANEISFIWNCCSGSIVTLRGFHLFFHQLAYIIAPDDDSSPIISKILGNGTVVDLKMIKPPFEKEFEENPDGAESIKIVPFYQRFY